MVIVVTIQCLLLLMKLWLLYKTSAIIVSTTFIRVLNCFLALERSTIRNVLQQDLQVSLLGSKTAPR